MIIDKDNRERYLHGGLHFPEVRVEQINVDRLISSLASSAVCIDRERSSKMTVGRGGDPNNTFAVMSLDDNYEFNGESRIVHSYLLRTKPGTPSTPTTAELYVFPSNARNLSNLGIERVDEATNQGIMAFYRVRGVLPDPNSPELDTLDKLAKSEDIVYYLMGSMNRSIGRVLNGLYDSAALCVPAVTERR